MWMNWKTTAGGLAVLLGAATNVLHSISSGESLDTNELSILVMGVGSAITGIFSKDKNITGTH